MRVSGVRGEDAGAQPPGAGEPDRHDGRPPGTEPSAKPEAVKPEAVDGERSSDGPAPEAADEDSPGDAAGTERDAASARTPGPRQAEDARPPAAGKAAPTYDVPTDDVPTADAASADAPADDSPPQEAAAGAGGPGGPGADRVSGGGRPRRRGRLLLRWGAAALALLVLGTAGAAYLYYRHLEGNLHRDHLDIGVTPHPLPRPTPNEAGQTPLNILLIGSDSRNTAEDVRLGGARADVGRKPLADVQMLVHVSADRSNMSVMSIPRDTRVTIPKCTDPETGTVYPSTVAAINQSLQHGGPGCTVATWKALTGIYIDHFMMVDFAGVVAMADAVGGVPVCVDADVWSHDAQGHGSGLKLTKGTHAVKGVQALQWLRTRYGFEDNSDIGRTKAQHMYMNSLARELKSSTRLSDPVELQALAEAATSALTVDDDLGSVTALYHLAGELKKVPAARITSITMPWVYGPGLAYVLPRPEDAEQTFALIRDDRALDGKDKKKATAAPPPSTERSELRVEVANGTGATAVQAAPGRASVIRDRLAGLGWSRAKALDTLSSVPETTLTYPTPDLRGDALALAKALKLPSDAVRAAEPGDDTAPAGTPASPTGTGSPSSSTATSPSAPASSSASASGSPGTLRLVIGDDWRTGTSYPKGSRAPGHGKVPSSAHPLMGDDTGACMEVNPHYTW
ncbi:LCP family protein [Streptomyces sp. NPDC059740]|uniref:LCP family protein n=1 Tax=Streptomyces sp. NPDC059740 TaxID=3346926 RepID=UPI00364C3A50